MNTIPLIFNEHEINRTILGDSRKSINSVMSVSVILLNNGGSHLRIQNLENLSRCGFEKIISIETNSDNYNLENFINKFPGVQFIIPQEEATPGELINIGISEISSDYVLVLNDAIQVSNFVLQPNVVNKLKKLGKFCYVPRIIYNKNQFFPVNFIPSVEKGVLKVETSNFVSDNIKTLYPTNFIALYDRKKFISLGGFDYTIKSPYWQNLDLALRAWLWGESINVTTAVQVSYLDVLPVEDTTSNLSQFRFYLKNLAAVFKEDHGEIPFSVLFKIISRSPCGLAETISQFNDARSWVKKNQFRFKMDAVQLVTDWGKEEK